MSSRAPFPSINNDELDQMAKTFIERHLGNMNRGVEGVGGSGGRGRHICFLF